MKKKRQNAHMTLPPVDMKEGVSDIKDDKNKKTMRKKRQNAHMKLPLLVWKKV